MEQETDIMKLDKDVRLQIGQRIQKMRISKGLSGADIGAYLDISANQVSRIETGKVKCSLEYIFVLSQLLCCSADYLLFGKEAQPVLSQEQVGLIRALYRTISK